MPTKKTIKSKAKFIFYSLICNISFWQYRDKYYKTYRFCHDVIEIENDEIIDQIECENISLKELAKKNREKI